MPPKKKSTKVTKNKCQEIGKEGASISKMVANEDRSSSKMVEGEGTSMKGASGGDKGRTTCKRPILDDAGDDVVQLKGVQRGRTTKWSRSRSFPSQSPMRVERSELVPTMGQIGEDEHGDVFVEVEGSLSQDDMSEEEPMGDEVDQEDPPWKAMRIHSMNLNMTARTTMQWFVREETDILLWTARHPQRERGRKTQKML